MANYALDTKAYDELKKNYNASVDKNAQTQIQDAQSAAQSQLKQAYINKLQNQQQMQKSLASQGIRGGASETAQLGIQNQYGQARRTANTTLANSVRDINNTAEANKLAYAQDLDAKKQQATENYNAEMRGYQREDEQLAYDRRQAQLTSTYSKYFSVSDLKKALKKTSDPQERAIINARIGYVQAIKKGGKWASTL